jgi:hypothetical protein
LSGFHKIYGQIYTVYRNKCKKCRNEEKREYYKKNKETLLKKYDSDYFKKYYKKNVASYREYYRENRETILKKYHEKKKDR